MTMRELAAQLRKWADALERGEATPYGVAQAMRSTAIDLRHEYLDRKDA